jgi:hypothetical protein
VYGVLAVPTKPLTGVKVTCPLGSLENVPLPGTLNVLCTPGVAGSRSSVVGARLAPVLAVSLLGAVRLTGVLKVVVVESLVATGATGGVTVTVMLAGLLACPRLSLMVYGVVAVPTKPATGVKVTCPLGSLANVPLPGTVIVF